MLTASDLDFTMRRLGHVRFLVFTHLQNSALRSATWPYKYCLAQMGTSCFMGSNSESWEIFGNLISVSKDDWWIINPKIANWICNNQCNSSDSGWRLYLSVLVFWSFENDSCMAWYFQAFLRWSLYSEARPKIETNFLRYSGILYMLKLANVLWISFRRRCISIASSCVFLLTPFAWHHEGRSAAPVMHAMLLNFTHHNMDVTAAKTAPSSDGC